MTTSNKRQASDIEVATATHVRFNVSRRGAAIDYEVPTHCIFSSEPEPPTHDELVDARIEQLETKMAGVLEVLESLATENERLRKRLNELNEGLSDLECQSRLLN